MLVSLRGNNLGGRTLFCGNNTPMQKEEPYQGDVCKKCSIIKSIAASVVEFETLTLFLNCQNTIIVRKMAKELGHSQPATPTRVDNATTNNCARNNLQQKKSKSFDMRLHWLRDQMNNIQFETHWMRVISTAQIVTQNIMQQHILN